MPRSHVTPPKPSSLLALVCLAVVCRLQPTWVALSLTDAATAHGIKPQRLSRITSRALTGFEGVVQTLTKMGRPVDDLHRDKVAAELVLARALLTVATSILASVPLRSDAIRALIVGAWLRLREQHPAFSQKSFCQALAVPTRTLRHWLERHASARTTAEPLAAEPTKPTKPNRPIRRRRFGFDVTLPDTQQAADTTDLKAFDVPLKLIASQDVGGRDQDLFDSVIVDDHESADLVVAALTEALDGREGFQVITDQGTPYLAEITRQAYDDLGAEHAPQREGDPIGKATVERAFGTVKQIAGPILKITSRIAKAVPALGGVELAKATTTLLLTALLRAYQAGARATRRADSAREGLGAETLARMAEKTREQARVHDNSARMLLAHIHDAYEINLPIQKFIRRFRRFPLEVLRQAEQAFGRQAHRDDIRNRTSYFATIVRDCHVQYRRQCARQDADQQTRDKLDSDIRRRQQQDEHWHQNPAVWLLQALETIAAQWVPESARLLFGGVGPGRAQLRGALARLLDTRSPLAAVDIATGVFRTFERAQHKHLGDAGLAAIAGVLQAHLETQSPAGNQSEVARQFAAAILGNTGPPTRPAPPSHLRT